MLTPRPATQLHYYCLRRWLSNAFPVAAATSAHAQSVTPPRAGLAGTPPGACADHVGSGPAAESGAAAALQPAGRASETAPLELQVSHPRPSRPSRPASGHGHAPGPRPPRERPPPPRPVAANSWFRALGGPSAACAGVPALVLDPLLAPATGPGTALFSVPLYPPFLVSRSEWVLRFWTDAEWPRC